MPGTWSTAAPPLRPGPYANFVAAAADAISSGVQGVAGVVGQASWGPIDRPYPIVDQASADQLFGKSGSVRRAAINALSGFDDGGASQVLALRAVGSGAAAATLVLDDATAADALTVTARYVGTRPNSWHATVQTNGTNKDLIIYESGVEIERYTNVTGGTNTAFAAAINAANSPYVTAAVTGTGNRALANIVGVIAGAGSFGASGGTPGSDGAALSLNDVATALTLLQGYEFDAVALAEGLETARDTFVSWLKDLNQTGRRAFGVIWGALGEANSAAALRSTTYDDVASNPSFSTYGTVARELVNVTMDIKRNVDGVVIPAGQVGERMLGVVANLGVRRSMVYLTWTGYQVNTPYSPALYETAQQQGIVFFSNDGINRIRIESQNTALLTVSDVIDSLRPSVHKKIRNVATDHFVQNTLTALYANSYIGNLSNTPDGRLTVVNATLGFLKTLEASGVLQPGSSSVDLDDRFVQGGSAVFLRIGIVYAQSIERIFLTVRVK